MALTSHRLYKMPAAHRNDGDTRVVAIGVSRAGDPDTVVASPDRQYRTVSCGSIEQGTEQHDWRRLAGDGTQELSAPDINEEDVLGRLWSSAGG